MPHKSYILALDQGTTGSTALLFDAAGKVVSSAYREVAQIYPEPGWVEQDAGELFQSCLTVAREALERAGVDASRLDGIGITNQRETTVVWNRTTGEPVYHALVWQCRRTAPLCETLKASGLDRAVREKTGLVIDAYFSATKIRWILDRIPLGQARAANGELLFGTVDSWLAWKFSGGAAHVTDYSNASRTMLFNIHRLEWDRELLANLNIPTAVLPRVLPSSQVFGETADGLFDGCRVPLAALAGDQQAALFGQACFEPGMAKNTYGTGCFVLLNTGASPVISPNGLVTTLAWGLGDAVNYAVEGSIFATGAAVQWLRDGLGIIGSAAESEALARSVPNNGGIYFVPALTGLGAPYWDMYARGVICGLTRGTSRAHLVRATLEATVYQTRDVVQAMASETKLKIPQLRVDGGGTDNAFLMQFQADILGIPIEVAATRETTALGVAYLAGLALGQWRDVAEIARQWRPGRSFQPEISADLRDSLYAGWQDAVTRARSNR